MSIKAVRNAAFVMMAGAGMLLSVQRGFALDTNCLTCKSEGLGEPQTCQPAAKGEGGKSECRDNMPGAPTCYTFGLDCTGPSGGR